MKVKITIEWEDQAKTTFISENTYINYKAQRGKEAREIEITSKTCGEFESTETKENKGESVK